MDLRHALRSRFPDIDPMRLPSGFDRAGDIAVLIVPPELIPHEREIGEFLLALHPKLRVVAKRDGEYSGEYRTLPLKILAGDKRLTTTHRENGVTFHLDLARVYFSVRLAHERARIAGLIQPGERVAVLCSGIGPFPLIIARHSAPALVIGMEKNPIAHQYALENLQVNRKLHPVQFLEGDAAQLLPYLGYHFDRVLVILPHGGEPLLPAALSVLAPSGHLHFYDMQAKGCHQATLAKVAAACAAQDRQMEVLGVTICGHCGPRVHRLCLDARIHPA